MEVFSAIANAIRLRLDQIISSRNTSAHLCFLIVSILDHGRLSSLV
jgi:hypothetical protein